MFVRAPKGKVSKAQVFGPFHPERHPQLPRAQGRGTSGPPAAAIGRVRGGPSAGGITRTSQGGGSCNRTTRSVLLRRRRKVTPAAEKGSPIFSSPPSPCP